MTEICRILHVCGGMNIGGVQNMLMKMYRTIDKEIIQFDFVVYDNKEQVYTKEIESLGGRVFFVDPPKKSNSYSFIKRLSNLIKENGSYDVVHAHTLHNEGLVLLAAKLAGVKNRIAHSRASLANNSNSTLRKVYFLLMRSLILYAATEFLACSKQAAIYLYGDRFVKKNKVTIISNGIEIEPYQIVRVEESNILRNQLKLKKDTLVIGHVGRFSIEKNQIFLLPIIKKLKSRNVDFKVIFVGDGPKRADLENKIFKEKLDSSVIFMGFRSDIPQFMKLFDVFILPSIFEGFGTVMIEAQAVGTPCLASDAVPIDTDTGLGIVRYKSLNESAEEWCNSLQELSSLPTIPLDISMKYIEQNGFEMNSIIKKYLNFYICK